MTHVQAPGDRWRTESGRSLAREVVRRLVSGDTLSGLDLGEHDGRVDLRGIQGPIPRTGRRFEADGWFVEETDGLPQFQHRLLEGLDLAGARLPGLRFFDSQLADCRFDGVSARGWRLWDTRVINCQFAEADLRDSTLGSWDHGRRNSWCRVVFAGADLRGAVMRAAAFEDCDFASAKLDGVRFEQCALRGVRFVGPLVDVLFDGRELAETPAPPPMERVDFAYAHFRGVEFKGTDLGNVRLPEDPDVRLIKRYDCVAERGLALLQGDDSVPARMLRAQFENDLRMARGHTDDAFNRRDYLASGGEDLLRLAESVFERASSECGH